MPEISQEKKEINEYFKKFVIEHKDYVFCYNGLTKSITKIETKQNSKFHKSWNELTTLMMVIEIVYNVESITTSKNYYCFEFGDKRRRIQDKGFDKIEALYNCCLRTLEEYWKAVVPNYTRGVEPFDSIDLD